MPGKKEVNPQPRAETVVLMWLVKHVANIKDITCFADGGDV
jgi:hypothetical protein